MKLFLVILITVSILSCKKQLTPQAAASINVVNAAINSEAVKVNSLGGSVIYASFPDLGYGSNAVFTVPAGNPVITIVLSSDTLHPIYNNAVSVKSNGIYSLYLAGQSPDFDTLLIADSIPYRTDSTAGIRFINLSPNSNPITVNLSAIPNLKEFTGIGYKQITAFKTYPANSTDLLYDFDIRDANSGDLITTYELNTPVFSNVTLVLTGLIGAIDQNAPGILRVNNY